jgi:hypothetical protein
LFRDLRQGISYHDRFRATAACLINGTVRLYPTSEISVRNE